MGKEKEEINILLLGETGVGKSTFINAFMNYRKYDSLDNARKGNLKVLIPSKFEIMDENFQPKEVKIGNNDSNEQTEKGTSATQKCRSYVFHTADENNKVLLRLIDTPGIGDTRGIDQDKKNFDNILKYIAKYQYLNGICILLKPNNSRLTVVFRFCIQELLSHLHKNAKENIVFCFTNTRSTFYRPGDTLTPLRKQLSEFKNRSNVEILTEQSTMYCFDNESFRFLAAIKGNVKFSSDEEKSFTDSWKRSVEESLRLLKYIMSRTPHKVRDTLSLNDARRLVLLLSEPLAKTAQQIQSNISLATDYQNKIKNNSKFIKELEGRLKIPQVDLQSVNLEYPRTVCTSSDCIEVYTVKDHVKTTNHVTHCHRRCYLESVERNRTNNSDLRGCSAFDPAGNCRKCHCNWAKHMHIYYDYKVMYIQVNDLNVEKEIEQKQSFQEKQKTLVEICEKRINDLKEEQKTISETNIEFAHFLRQSAIAVFNDAYVEYLDHFITEEKVKKGIDPENYDEAILKGLEDSKRVHVEKVAIIKKAIENNDPNLPNISPERIGYLEQNLYTLPINGQTLKNIKETAESAQTNAFKYEEKHYRPRQSGRNKSSVMFEKATKFVQNLFSRYVY